MDPLLIVLVIGCALVPAVHIARGVLARSRSVERHQQALGTLADITQHSEGAQRGLDDASDHQAHVRVIGPSGHASPGNGPALPPPRTFSSSGTASQSPFRRPSRTAPSLAAMDAVAASANLGRSPDTQLLRSGPPRPPVRPPSGQGADHTALPGLPPELALFDELGQSDRGLAGEPTRPVPIVHPPVPIVQPQIFHFDDLSPNAEKRPAPAGSSPDVDKLRPAKSHFGRHRAVAGVVLAAAAVAVALAAVGIALNLRTAPRQGPQHLQTAATQTPVTAAPAPKPTSTPPTTSAPVTTTVPAPSYPAVLVSSSRGTATYQLSSPSASIVVSANGPCWLEVRANSPLGRILYEATLQAGDHASVTGPAWLRLGNPPEVAVKVDGTPMPVPGSRPAVPINLQFSLG